MKRLGIVGGLGPQTSSQFFVNVNNAVIAKTQVQPNMLMENVAMPEAVLQRLASGETPNEVLNLLSKTVLRLQNSGAEFIVIPCNTVHVFIDQLRELCDIPIMSIIEESAIECQKLGFRSIGVMASTTSIEQRLHINALEARGIEVVLPSACEQEEISEIIVRIVTNTVRSEDALSLDVIAASLKLQGAEGILLACTDLRTIVNCDTDGIPFVDSTTALEKATAIELLN
ncbi:amino acid racemase [archaeon]|jgi:aspartate racemase|nr:amino acid racemase [archaeon]MBT6762631.1 amino acid racemase [archaeon]